MEQNEIIKYVPVQLFIRFMRRDNEPNERAILVARRDDGTEYTFIYEGINGYGCDLVVADPLYKYKKEMNKEHSTDNETYHRWCEDCEGKYIGTRNCPNCNGTNTGIDEPTIQRPKKS